MLDQTITLETLKKVYHRNDYKLNADFSLDQALEHLIAALHGNTFSFNFEKNTTSGQKPIFRVPATDFQSKILIKKLYNNIAYIYKIKIIDRNSIIKQVSELINSEKSFHIIKLDIKDFFENIDVVRLLQHLRITNILSIQTISLLDKLLRNTTNMHGLPRGIAISSLLSEIYMKKFDDEIKKLPSVFFYTRYVDDIMIFSCIDNQDLVPNIFQILQKICQSMEFNSNKSFMFSIQKESGKIEQKSYKLISSNKKLEDTTVKLCFLGYWFDLSKQIQKTRSSPKEFAIHIAPEKSEKIKRRILSAIFFYINEKNKPKAFISFKRRIRILTSNYAFKKGKSKKIRSGIFYNYQFINEPTEIFELDTYLRQLLEGKHSRFLNLFTSIEKKEILKMSFRAGFRDKIVTNCTYNRFMELKKPW